METALNVMFDNLTQVEEYIIKLFDEDNLIDQWVLTRTPYPMLLVLFTYLLFVLKIGPRFMENRRPYDLTVVMRVYNIFQVIANCRMLYYPLVVHSKSLPYIVQLSCSVPKATDEGIDELKLRFIYLLHDYLVLKMLDLLDTVFMILRKKNSQVTFLHVYHHGVMVFGAWYTLQFLMPVHSVIPGAINALVHVVMYSYFFLATFGEPVQKYLWWKKYLTKLQLAQFIIILIYISTLYFNGCPVSKGFTYFWMANVFAFFCLFVNFYVRAYITKPKTVERKNTAKKKS